MFFHCPEMHLYCFLPSVAWFQLALISSDCFESLFQSVKYGSIVCRGSSMEKALKLRLFTASCEHPQRRSGYVRSGHSRPQRPSFLGHVAGKRGALDSGSSRYRMLENFWHPVANVQNLQKSLLMLITDFCPSPLHLGKNFTLWALSRECFFGMFWECTTSLNLDSLIIWS